MTLPIVVAYAILFLIVSGLIRIAVSSLLLPRLQKQSRARAMDVVVRFRQAYGQGQLDIDSRLYLAANAIMTDMVRDADSLTLPMLVQYKPVVTDGTSVSDHSIHADMERHPDENVRRFHKEWSEAIMAVVMTNTSGITLYLLLLVLLFSPVILIVGIWNILKRPVGRRKLHPAAILDRVVGFVARHYRAVYRNA